MENQNIFIHIPKCGGSSFVGILKQSIPLSEDEIEIPTHLIQKIGVNTIGHLDFSKPNRRFRIPEIFDEKFENNFKDKNIFMLARNPIDRLFSEFNFQFHILNGKIGNSNAAIISKLKPLPNSFEKYIQFCETHNYQCKFLLGRNIADPNPISENEFQKIIKCIEKLNIHLGLTELYEDFVNTFCEITNQHLNSEILQRKQTPKHLKTEISYQVKRQIELHNSFDFRLYEYIKNNIQCNLSKDKIKFKTKSTDTFII